MKNILTLVVLSLGLAACGAGNLSSYSHRERRVAPQNEKQMGFLVSQIEEAELVALLKAEPKVQYRVLNAEHRLYEIYGLSEAEVRQHLRHAKVSRNDFIPLEQPQFHLLDEESTIPGFDPCRESDDSPLALIKGEGDITDGSVIEFGHSLKLSSSSEPHPDHKSKLKVAWAIQGPPKSAYNQTLHTTSNLEIKPEAMGLYQILLVVQDERSVCAAEMMHIVVTGNVAFKLPDTENKDLDLTSFTHLRTIHAQESWKLSQGEGITVAVIDSGVNYNNPLLAANIQINSKEIASNGIDDDDNGFVDDVYGYDFANKDAFPFDDVGHGSHVAGLIAGLQFGMAQKAKILAVKALGPMGGDIGSIVAGIYYAVDQGAQVINMSFGNYGKPDPKLFEALDYAEKKRAIIVAAAGNGNPYNGTPINTDEMPNFPSAAENSNIIAVAASSLDSALASYSNFGFDSVDIVLPGGDMPNDPIVSCAYENPQQEIFENMSGTSMASPIAAGLVAQMLSLNPKLSPTEVKEVLMNTGPAKDELQSLIGSGRHVDAEAALLKVKGTTSQLLM